VGKDNMRHSHATHDLYNAIDRGDFPEWEYAAQVRLQLYLSRLSNPWRCTLPWKNKLWRCTYPVLTPQLSSCSALRMSCSLRACVFTLQGVHADPCVCSSWGLRGLQDRLVRMDCALMRYGRSADLARAECLTPAVHAMRRSWTWRGLSRSWALTRWTTPRRVLTFTGAASVGLSKNAAGRQRMRQNAVMRAFVIVRRSVLCHPALWCDCVYRWYQKSCFGSMSGFASSSLDVGVCTPRRSGLRPSCRGRRSAR